MITIHVSYQNLLRRRAGVERETVQLPKEASLAEAIDYLAERHGAQLREVLFGPDGKIASYLVIFRNGRLVGQQQYQLLLANGDELMLFLAISGG
ncbi:MAG: MoaD/ThiS family protein [Anaerolineae bacterium]